jgi:hypothetical protein
MAKPHSPKKSARQKRAGFSKPVMGILIAVIAAASIVAFSMGPNTSKSVFASQKKYKGTKPVVQDKQTGQPRIPTDAEVQEMVASLSTLASRPENLPQTATNGGAIAIDLQGGYGGVFLARLNPDLTWETKCVFTFEEGAEFLGLVEDSTE